MAPVITAGKLPGSSAFRWPSSKRGQGFKFEKLDAAENFFFLRELEHISAKLYKRLYFELKARTLVPTENEGMSAGDMSFTYRMWDFKGQAIAISDYSKDLPLVNEYGEEQTQRLQAYGSGYSYSQEEIAAAAKLNRPLEADRAMVCKEVMDQKLDKVFAVGDPNCSLRGILTLQNTLTGTASAKAAGGTSWMDANGNLVASPDECLADLNFIVRDQRVQTGGTEKIDTIVLPIAQYQAISTKARSPVSDTTILEFFEKNNPGVKVVEWEYLKNGAYNPASPSTVPTTDRMLGFRSDPVKVKGLMALEFTQLPPEPRNLAFIVNAWMKTGGVISPYPKSIYYLDSI